MPVVWVRRRKVRRDFALFLYNLPLFSLCWQKE